MRPFSSLLEPKREFGVVLQEAEFVCVESGDTLGVPFETTVIMR